MNILDKIVATKQHEVSQLRYQETALRKELRQRSTQRSLFAALSKPGKVQVLAEVKKASPSAGVIREDFAPTEIARTYVANGAAAISVLTDQQYFQGHLDYLTQISQSVSCPVLRKDFLIDPLQIVEAHVAQADAVLLIAEILPGQSLKQMLDHANELKLEALVELYEPENLSRVIDAGAKIIGINNRNLRTFETRLEHTLDLAEKIPSDCCLISESGIRNYADVQRLASAGVNAVLVGESLMRAPDIGLQLRQLLGASD